MRTTKKHLLVEEIIKIINTFSPEYVDNCDEASNKIYDLVDNIEEFDDEQSLSDPKEDALKEIAGVSFKNSLNSLNEIGVIN